MKGFFQKKEIKDFNPKNPQSCASCGLYKDCVTPRMKPFGSFKRKVMIIGEFPERRDDRKGRPFQGRKGKLLKKILKGMDFDIFKDAINIHACLCAPKDDLPSPIQIYCCRKRVIECIKKYQPKLIILLGSFSLQSIIGHYWKKKLGSIHKWRGWCIPDQTLKTWICPVYDPYFIESKEERNGNNLAKLIWKQDFLNILKHINKPFPAPPDTKITYIWKAKELKKILPDLMNAKLLSFDYESTGIKPHSEEQKLVSVSAVIGPEQAYAWMASKVKNKLWKKVLQSKVPKTAHNLQMEDSWSFFKIGTPVTNWKWCSMNAAHIGDNRRGINALKFQTYIHYGVSDYDSHINPYLASPKKDGANGINNIFKFIEEYGEKELLKYNCFDSIYGWNLTLKQMEEFYGPEYYSKLGLQKSKKS